MSQQPGEKLSAFLRRMERILNKLVHKGGLSPTSADKARLDQLIKGAIRSDMMLLNLRLRERQDKPPTFLQLLNDIRTEEEFEAARRKLAPSKAVHIKAVSVPAETEMDGLRAQIQALKLQVTELTALATTSPSLLLSPESTVAASTEALEEDKDVQALKKEVRKLRKQVSVMSVTPNEVSPRAR